MSVSCHCVYHIFSDVTYITSCLILYNSYHNLLSFSQSLTQEEGCVKVLCDLGPIRQGYEQFKNL